MEERGETKFRSHETNAKSNSIQEERCQGKEIASIHKYRKCERMQRSTAKKKLLFSENCMNYLIGKIARGITDEQVTASLPFHSRRTLYYVSSEERGRSRKYETLGLQVGSKIKLLICHHDITVLFPRLLCPFTGHDLPCILTPITPMSCRWTSICHIEKYGVIKPHCVFPALPQPCSGLS